MGRRIFSAPNERWNHSPKIGSQPLSSRPLSRRHTVDISSCRRLAPIRRRCWSAFMDTPKSADTQLSRLRAIEGSEHWLVVSIQGLHRFYQSEREEVVASWMTRQDRELAIGDNIAHVSSGCRCGLRCMANTAVDRARRVLARCCDGVSWRCQFERGACSGNRRWRRRPTGDRTECAGSDRFSSDLPRLVGGMGITRPRSLRRMLADSGRAASM